MRLEIALLATLLAAGDTTFIRKWNLAGCAQGGVSSRCNRIPAGHCCNQGRVIGGSVRIDNLPSFVDISVPYVGREGTRRNGGTMRCGSVQYTAVRAGNIGCYSDSRVGTGLWIHCSRYFNTNQCLSTSSAPHKRDTVTGDFEELDFDPNHPGYIDEEEAALPSVSFHGLNGELISEDEFNRMSELELAHETNGTLHLLYPDHYPHDYMEWYELLANDTTAAGVLRHVSHADDVSSAPPATPAR